MRTLESGQRGSDKALKLDPRVLVLMAVQAEFACLSDRSAQKQRLRRQRDALLDRLDDAQREQLRYIAVTLEMLLERAESGDGERGATVDGDQRGE